MFVFVYGTLKEGEGNNHRLTGARKVKEAFIPGHKLLDCGFPVAHPEENAIVKGEIWDIGDPKVSEKSKHILRGLDSLEGYSEYDLESSMYHRKELQTICGEQVSMYIGNPARRFAQRLTACGHKDNVYEWKRRTV